MSRFRPPANWLQNVIGRTDRLEAVQGKLVTSDGRLRLDGSTTVGKTSKTGTGTIGSGSTSVAVTHGLTSAPAAGRISVIPTNNPTNDPGHIWVSAIGASQFTVNCRNDPGAGGLTFGWMVVTT